MYNNNLNGQVGEKNSTTSIIVFFIYSSHYMDYYTTGCAEMTFSLATTTTAYSYYNIINIKIQK